MALVSIWIKVAKDWEQHLIDPDNYLDCQTGSEMAWRIKTGRSHRDYCAAHAKALIEVAERLARALLPAPYLALPAPDYQARNQRALEDFRREKCEKAKPKPKRKQSAPEVAHSLGMSYDRIILNPTYVRDGVGRACVTLAGDHEYIEAMFRVYSGGRTRLLI
jgi:hypothetical protein